MSTYVNVILIVIFSLYFLKLFKYMFFTNRVIQDCNLFI